MKTRKGVRIIEAGLLLLLCTGALAQVPGLGACPDVDVVRDFNLTKYLGDWFEIQKYITIPELLEKCITARYKKNSDGTLKIFHSKMNVLTKESVTTEGWANFVDNKHIAKLYVDFPRTSLVEHFILDTDYDNYAVVFTCNDISFANLISVWIWARERKPSPEVLETALKVLDKYQLSRNFLMKTDQKKCPPISLKQ